MKISDQKESKKDNGVTVRKGMEVKVGIHMNHLKAALDIGKNHNDAPTFPLKPTNSQDTDTLKEQLARGKIQDAARLLQYETLPKSLTGPIHGDEMESDQLRLPIPPVPINTPPRPPIAPNPYRELNLPQTI